MSWKTGDYFGSSNCPLGEICYPIVTLHAPDGTTTTLPFTSCDVYQSFLIWVTWDFLSHGYTLTIHKAVSTSIEYSAAEKTRCDQIMKDFHHYRNETL